MSYTVKIYIQRKSAPSPQALADRLASGSPSIVFEDPPNCLEWDCYVPVLLDGTQSGFEADSSAITNAKRESYDRRLANSQGSSDPEADLLFRRILHECDWNISLTSRDADERLTAELVARTLGEMARGYYLNPRDFEIVSWR
jgi:hypothetical protein